MISILVFLVLLGLVLYAINAAVPLPPWIKVIINCIAIAFVFLYLLDAFGFYHSHLSLR